MSVIIIDANTATFCQPSELHDMKQMGAVWLCSALTQGLGIAGDPCT